MDVLKWLARLIPEDKEKKGGWGPFEIPDRCKWMESVFLYHDLYYEVGPENKMRLSDIDWRIFKALTILAEQPEDPMERCRRATDVCKYWRLMRVVGRYLYGRHYKQDDDDTK